MDSLEHLNLACMCTYSRCGYSSCCKNVSPTETPQPWAVPRTGAFDSSEVNCSEPGEHLWLPFLRKNHQQPMGHPFQFRNFFLQLLIRNNKSLGKIKMNVSVYLNGFISRSLTSLIFTATGWIL